MSPNYPNFSVPDEQIQQFDWRIVFGSLKGGVAKTTGTWCAAVELANRCPDDEILLVCGDKSSQSLTNAYQRAVASGYNPRFRLIQWHNHIGYVEGVRAEMQRLGCRHAIMDIGGGDLPLLQAALQLANELIIPVAPQLVEIEKVRPTLVAASQVAHLNDVAANVLFCKVNRPRRAQEWREHMDEDMGLPMLETQIPFTAFYQDCLETVPADGGYYGSMLSELAMARIAEADEN